jgi:hypothetical protein
MLFFADDEQDKDPDEEEDADADSEEDSEEEEDPEDDEDSEDSEDDEDSEEEDDSDDEDDDNKPVTRKELRELLKGNKNDRNARRRVSSKYKKGRDTRQPSETDKRLEALERSEKERQLLTKKLDFASEHGLTKKQVNHVFRLTKRPTAKFLNKPHVKAALDAIKQQENVSRNTPSGSGKRGKAPGGKKWTELPAEDRQANFADKRASILANKRR